MGHIMLANFLFRLPAGSSRRLAGAPASASENLWRVRRSPLRRQDCGPSDSPGGATMKFWIGPLGGALTTGAYGMLRLGEQWNIGGEHAFRASGTLLAYVLLGAFIGLIVAGLFFSALSDETRHSQNQTPLRRVSPKLLDKPPHAGRECPVSHIIPNKTKVRDRVQRIGTQIEALQRALNADLGFVDILKALSETRSSINDLSAELVEDYIRMHADRAQDSDTDRVQAVQGL